MKKLHLTFTFLILFTPMMLLAQGWEKTYDSSLDEIITSADQTLDGGVIMAGIQFDEDNNLEYSFLFKTDADGNLQWEYYDSIHIGSFVNTQYVLASSDGNFLLSSIYGNTPPNNNAVVQKITPGGNILWEYTMPSNFLDYTSKITETTDGGYLLYGIRGSSSGQNLGLVKVDNLGNVLWEKEIEYIDNPMFTGGVIESSNSDVIITGYQGYFNNNMDAFIKRMDSDGNMIWEKEYDLGDNDYGLDPVELSNGDIVMLGSAAGDFTLTYATLLKVDANGNQIWYQTYTSLLDQVARRIVATADGGFALGGFTSTFSTNNDLDYYLLKTDELGNELWAQNYGRSNDDVLGGLMTTPSGGFYLAGYTTNNDGTEDAFLIKTDSLGYSLTNILTGNIFNDENLDCVLSPSEFGLEQWLVEVVNGNEQYLTLTDSLGNYSFTLDTGTYTMNIFPISPYWALCDSSYTINFSSFYDTVMQDIPAQAIIDCPLLNVSIGAPFVRRCFENRYTVNYCNYGTEVAEDASVVVTVDPAMVATFTSIPYTTITNGVEYTFPIGDVPIGTCGTFYMDLLLASPQMPCDSIPLGATHCVEARIYPDSICMPSNNWSGASVELDALCNGDSIQFLIRNVGSAPTQSDLQYIVVEDDVILFDGFFSLNPNETETVTVTTNGSTFRLEAEQEPFHPGMSMPSVSVENCGTEGMIFNFGFINIFAQDDGDPFVDIDCQQNIGAYDPNDKRGFPLGYGNENYISRGQDIEYVIRFQNTGTDTAFNVVIEDKLSELLDITSLRPGASSHPYEFDITGDGILKFTFENIMLPDSNVNEPASNGFVKFKVAQQPNLDLETQIHNSAAIFFDFNAPIITNQTLHTIGESLITVSIDNTLTSDATEVKVFPNPFAEAVNIEIEGVDIKNGTFNLFDATGRRFRQEKFNNKKFTIQRGDLRTGIYFFTIEDENQLISSGKLIVH